MAKLPFGPFSNGSIFMHYSFATASTTCIVSSTRAQILVERLYDVCSSSFMQLKSSKPHPFIPATMFFEHCRIANEDDRNDIDKSVCNIENRSGVSLHNFGSRTRAKVGEYALLQRELHMQDALIIMADHCFAFHTAFGNFLVDEEQNFAQLLAQRGAVIEHYQGDHIRALLKLNASMSTWTLEQLRALEKRLKVQLRVVSSLTIQHRGRLTNAQSDLFIPNTDRFDYISHRHPDHDSTRPRLQLGQQHDESHHHPHHGLPPSHFRILAFQHGILRL
jgi:hypothetical protein